MSRSAALLVFCCLVLGGSGFHRFSLPSGGLRRAGGLGRARERTAVFGLKPWQIGNVPLPGGGLPQKDGPNPFDPSPEEEEEEVEEVADRAAAEEPASEAAPAAEASSTNGVASKSKAFGKGGKGKKKGKKKAKGGAAAAPQASTEQRAALAALVDLENQLHEALGETEKGGVVAQPKAIGDRVSALVEEVEGIADMQLRGEELVYALVGDWELRYTDNEAFIKSKGITGTAALPFCNLEAMWHRISTVRPTAQLVEIVKIFGGKQLVVLKGDCSLLDMTILDAGFDEIEVNGGGSVPQPAEGYRLQLRCTFVGDKVWIGRSASNAVFAWRRRAAGDLESTLKESMG